MLRKVAALVAIGALCACKITSYPEIAVDLDAGAVTPERPSENAAPRRLSFAIASMESPRDTHAGYARLLDRVARASGVGVEMVQRRTYREVNDMLTAGHLDVALVCTGGYLDLRRRAPKAFEVLVVPVVDGATTYESLVIVPSSSDTAVIGDLAGRRFAYTDELSFSGHTFFVHLLTTTSQDPERFFRSTTFTRSHDRSIHAVASELVDGAVVNSLVYRHLLDREPDLATKTRVIFRSAPFGMMPIVASTRLPNEERARLRDALIGLHLDAEAAAAMRTMHIDRFVVPPPGLYDSAEALIGGGG